MTKRILLILALLAAPAVAALYEGPAGTSAQVSKYLLDRGVDAAAARKAGLLRIVSRGDTEQVLVWDLGVPLPVPEQLEPAEQAKALLAAPPGRRVFDNGAWRLKTDAELAAEKAASVEGPREAEAKDVRAKLLTELASAGFTNQPPFSTRSVLRWIDDTPSVTPQQEKKILRLLDRYEKSVRPEITIPQE